MNLKVNIKNLLKMKKNELKNNKKLEFINETSFIDLNDIHRFSWWTGFCDAEGNFQIYPKKRLLKSGELSKVNVGNGFHLSLHKRDLSLIKDIHNKLNLGTVYESESKDDVRLAVNDKVGINKICKIFSMYPLLTMHQLTRFLLLKEIFNNDIKEFKTLDLFNQ